MFGQKTKGSSVDPQNKNGTPIKEMKIEKGDFSFVEKLPVFTMKTDLENLDNPNYTEDAFLSREELWEKKILKKEPEETDGLKNPFQKIQKKSPFLDIENASTKTAPTGKIEVQQKESPFTKTEPTKKAEENKPQEKEKENEKEESSGGFFSFFKKKKEEPTNIPLDGAIEIKKEYSGSDLKKPSLSKPLDKSIPVKNESASLEKPAQNAISPSLEETLRKKPKEKHEITLVSNAALLKKAPAKTETKKEKVNELVSDEKITLEKKSFSSFMPFAKNKKINISDKKEKEISIPQKETISLNVQTQEQKAVLDKIKEEEKSYSEKNLRLKDELAAKEKELDEKKASIGKIEAQIIEMSEKKKELDIDQEKLSASKKDLDTLNVQLQEQKAALDKIKEEEKSYSEKNLRLKDELAAKEKELNEKKASIGKIETEFNELSNKKKELDDLNIQLETQGKILNIIKGEESEYTKKNLLLKDELVATERELNEKKAAIRKAEEAEIDASSNKEKELDTKSSNEVNISVTRKQPSIPALKTNFQSNLKPMEKMNKKLEENDTKSNKTLIFAVALLFILMIVTGGYYSWTNRGASEPEVYVEIPEITQPEVIEETIPLLSLESSNYLSIDLENTSTINETLDEYLAKVAETKSGSLIEFILTDKMNNPISFESFAKAFSITLPQDVLDQLNQDFNLYVYNYGEDKLKLGLSVSSKNDATLAFVLKANEVNLVQQLSSLILEEYTPASDKNIFKEGTYNKVEVRYQNITDPEEIAIDYTVYDSNLIIGTTKSAAFSIIDRKIKDAQ